MTYRDFYTAVANANLSAEMTEFAEKAIKTLDDKNAKRKSTGTPNQRANEDIKATIVEFLAANAETAYTAANLVNEFGFNAQKISALMRQIVAAGKATAFEGKNEKKNKVKFYRYAG